MRSALRCGSCRPAYTKKLGVKSLGAAPPRMVGVRAGGFGLDPFLQNQPTYRFIFRII